MTRRPEHPLAKVERILAAARRDSLLTSEVASGKPREPTREDIIRSLNTLRRNGVIDEDGEAVHIPAPFRRPPTIAPPTTDPEDQP